MRRLGRRLRGVRGSALAAAPALALLALVVAASAARAQIGNQPLGRPPEPAGNPLTAAKANLGKALFWDEQLSSTRTVACGTCHRPGSGDSDPRAILGDPRATHPGADAIFGTGDDVTGSPGVPLHDADGSYDLAPAHGLDPQVTRRRSKPTADAAFSSSLFWDGRADDALLDPITGEVVLPAGAALESQVLHPPVDTTEMGHVGRSWNDVVLRVATSTPLALSPEVPPALAEWIGGRSYRDLFAEAFGTPEVTPARIAMAIASHERTLVSDQTPFDAVLAGEGELIGEELVGRRLFTDMECEGCHKTALLSDNQFHYTGVRPPGEDPGRFEVTGDEADLGKVRTPSLRNVALRAPYMHNGRFATLGEVIDFYERGGDFAAPTKDPRIRGPRGLSARERAGLVAFLTRPLTDPRVAAELPPFDRPRLYTESDRVPAIVGEGVAGTGGHKPKVVALEPPFAGNPGFTVGVYEALGGAQAVLVIDAADPGPGPTVPAAGSFARFEVPLAGVGGSAGEGFGSATLAIPADEALVGEELYGRWYVDDPGAPGGVAVTPAFRMRIFAVAAPPAGGVCIADGATLCLQGARFQVRARFENKDGVDGEARAVRLTPDTGTFWFFNEDNVELVVKVLDGCALGERFWVFAAGLTDVAVRMTVTDVATGESREYVNPPDSPFEPVQDTAAFACDAVAAGASGAATSAGERDGGERARRAAAEVAALAAAGPAVAGRASVAECGEGPALCLAGDRFAVTAEWTTAEGGGGEGVPVALTADSGYFWFFDSANVEVVIKVLDACVVNDRFWVFAGGLTNVGVRLTVTDTETGASWTHDNSVGTAFRPVQDVAAFTTCQ